MNANPHEHWIASGQFRVYKGLTFRYLYAPQSSTTIPCWLTVDLSVWYSGDAFYGLAHRASIMLVGHANAVLSVAFPPYGDTLASGTPTAAATLYVEP